MTKTALTSDDINKIAFITPVNELQINNHLIAAVENNDLYEILGATLHSVYVEHHSFFDSIALSYINPFVAYQVKYLSLKLLASETTEQNESLMSAIQQAEKLARKFKTNLQNYLFNTYGILPQSINGFTIPKSILNKNEKNMTLKVSPTEQTDIAPFIFTVTEEEFSTFNLPHKLKNASLVFVNNSIINPTNYSGIGTSTIQFTNPLDTYDKLVVTF